MSLRILVLNPANLILEVSHLKVKRKDQCFLLLREAQNWVGVKPTPDDKEELADLQERIEEALVARDAANEEFLNAILGR